jgi:hypothetical protein
MATDHSDTDDNGDGEGVWSPDIEQCFREALLLFPPCGRRKHILQEEGGGKMYGRNELIARHIRMRTGKIRSRKQVSSHIQVLARRKAKAESGGQSGPAAGVQQQDTTAGSSSPANSVAQLAPPPAGLSTLNDFRGPRRAANTYCDIWTDRPIVTTKLRLVEFSAFIEHRQLAQHLPPANDQPIKPTLGLGPMTDLALAANINHGQQANPDALSLQQGLLMPAAAYDMGPAKASILASNPAQQQQPAGSSPNQIGLHHFNQATQMGAPANHPYQTLQQQSSSNSSGNNNNSQLQQPLNNNQQHHQQMNQRNSEANNFIASDCASPTISSYQQQPAPTSSGFTRHSYVKIDYRVPTFRQSDKLERIDISQIQDKFPEIGGSEGLFQRGPSDAFFLIKFWADINNDFEYNIDDQNSYFGFSCHFESIEPFKNITCSTKACSYGLQVVEKVEKIYGAFNSTNGRYSYGIDRSPMCEFMIRFIKKLRQLPRASQMNSVLENFTVLQVITNESTSEILLGLAFVFEIASAEQNNGSQYHVYKLTKN